jgi:hypothetical protein
VTLVHTPDLQVPHGRLAVSSLHQLQTHNGVAFVADLTLDGQFAGRIENDGNGGPTTYYGLNSSPFNWRHLADYVQASRHRGQPVSEEFVLDALVDFTDRRGPRVRSGLRLCVAYMSVTGRGTGTRRRFGRAGPQIRSAGRYADAAAAQRGRTIWSRHPRTRER